eukprot:scaffold53019_cov71-Phaeocystis_antarctica.AAC.1
MEDVLGRGGEGSRTLMWTRRVECAGPSARPMSASPRAGGWKFLLLGSNKISLEGPGSDLPWGPRAAPAPVPAHQRTSIHGHPAHKARPLMGETACRLQALGARK